MWSGPIHDPAFVGKVLEHVEASAEHYGTSARMKGMLTVAKEVRPHAPILTNDSNAVQELVQPFYFTADRVAGHFHCVCPSLDEIASVELPPPPRAVLPLSTLPCRSALLHAGHEVSRSHAAPGSIKTNAAHADIFDIYRSWIKTHPVHRDKISPNSPSFHLLDKEPKCVLQHVTYSHHSYLLR